MRTRVLGKILHFALYKKKLTLVDFLAVLCDGSTEKSVMEQEAIPETGKPTPAFLEVVAPSESIDAPELKKAIIDTFKRNSLEPVIEKIFCLLSDGALVNCGKHSGLIKLFQENYLWVLFVWCFSHKFELALRCGKRSTRTY